MQHLSNHLWQALLKGTQTLAWQPDPAEFGPAQRVSPAEISRQAALRVVEQVRARAGAGGAPSVAEVVSEALFHEQQRLVHPDDPARAEADRVLLNAIGRRLPRSSAADSAQLLQQLVEHYAGEIQGHFDPRTYMAATRLVPAALTLLLHGSTPAQLLQHPREQRKQWPPNLDDQLILSGRIASLKRLARLGTVILTPTHQSHLDSPLIGYAIYRLGLPPFVYGAGLNLFANPVMGFFLGRLGSYSIDRRKTDPLYREVLKAYATVSLECGQHHLFFPGGTRARSGAVELHLKKGLLGAGIAAFGNNLRAGKASPRVFIVPCTVSFPLILEAESLVEEHLQREAGGRYIPAPDQSEQVRTWLRLMESSLKLELQVHVRIGQALDPFGNLVDDEGQSHDARGRAIDPAGYLLRDGRWVEDGARDREYTHLLSEQIVKAFHRDNTILPTHAVAHAVLTHLRSTRPAAENVRFLRGLRMDGQLPRAVALQAVDRLRRALLCKAERNGLQLDASIVRGDAETITATALQAFASYHEQPALRMRGEMLEVGDENLTFFYANRLSNYDLLFVEGEHAGRQQEVLS